MTVHGVITKTVVVEQPSPGHLGRTRTVVVNPQPLTTIDGNYMVGDTDSKQARNNNMSDKKAKKEFNRIDKNHDGVLSNSEICDERSRYTVNRIHKQRSLWSKIRCFFSPKYKQQLETEKKNLKWESGVTNAYRNLQDDEAIEVRKKYDNKNKSVSYEA